MKRTVSTLRGWLIFVTLWIAIIYFYALLGVYGLNQYILRDELSQYFFSDLFHLEIFLTGSIFGTLFLLVNKLTDYPGLQKKSFGFVILVKSLLYIIAMLSCGIVVFQFFLQFGMITWTEFELFRAKADALFIASIGTYFLFFILLTNFFIQINKKFGPGVLFDLLTGKYHHPRKENLILLFIDLKGSTTIAEKLGHEKYSEFIKECVHELTPILIKNDAKVYQYVGDEIVLHWRINEGLEELKCINTFFQFDRRLRELENGFITKYGVAPTFKAGMDMGEVTVTEIGELKREIAFHGDVLNTASRLEQKCNEHSESLLVTESLIENVPGKNGYDFQFVNDITLRGKQEKVKYFAVRHA